MLRFLLERREHFWEHPNLQIWVQYGDFRFWPISAQQKSDFLQLVP